jgi:tRNA(His) 5'-end guanylyltransferase
MKKDSLGDRMKGYEFQYSGQQLLPLIPIVARMDGKAFHTFTAGLKRPFDERLSNLMVATTRYLVQETNARVGYTQSDEISLVWYSEEIDSETFFDAKLLKMTSVLAAMTTAFFNRHMPGYLPEKADKLPLFDARVYNVPTDWEATNYLIWREMDATRNSISMAAQSMFSHNELQNKGSSEMQEMMFQKHGVNWNNYPDFFKRGTYLARRKTVRPFTAAELDKLPEKHAARKNPNLTVERQDVVKLEIPPLRRITNREEVIFDGAEPLLKADLEPVTQEE